MTLDVSRLAPMANAIRALSMDAVQAANSGHPGMPMGMADVATVLYSQFLKFDPATPKWPDRDRFVQMTTVFGGERIVAWLAGESLPRIC